MVGLIHANEIIHISAKKRDTDLFDYYDQGKKN